MRGHQLCPENVSRGPGAVALQEPQGLQGKEGSRALSRGPSPATAEKGGLYSLPEGQGVGDLASQLCSFLG